MVLLSPLGLRSEKSLLTTFHGCNNEAELHALCAALGMAAAAGVRRLHLHGDSDVAIGYVRGARSTQIERLQRLVAAARTALAGFDEVQLLWLPHRRNVEADGLARQALGLPVAAAKPATRRRRRG